MTTFKDFKGRIYKIIDVSRETILMECIKTGDFIRVRSNDLKDVGF